MKEDLVVFNSDQVNAYRMRMPLETLIDSLEQRWEFGLPLLLNHDRHRPVGWAFALGIYLVPGIARLTGLYLTPETGSESELNWARIQCFIGTQIEEEFAPFREELVAHLGPNLFGDEIPFGNGCAALCGAGLAKRVFADIFEREDKDHLVDIRGLIPVGPGVFERDGLLVFASELFRRSLSRHNTLNEPLLGLLPEIAKDPSLKVKIRLDPDLVGLAKSHRRSIEFAYWWGPKFSEDLNSIPPGVTRYEANERQRYFSGVHWADFWWHDQDGLKTLECEEVLDLPSLGVGNDKYGCRYVHSILSSSLKMPSHLDGAIRIYDEDKMVTRLGQKISEAGRHSEYMKLWRIDGPIEITHWKELITHFYRDNELVGEYLGGVDESGYELPKANRPWIDPISRLVPGSTNQEEGIKISLSYHSKICGPRPAVQLEVKDTFTSNALRTPFVEADSFELIKTLRRCGVEVKVTEEVARISFEDGYVNLGMLMHAGNHAVELAEQSLIAFSTLVRAWKAREDDRNVSFNIGLDFPDRIVHIAFAGHVSDFSKLFDQWNVCLPKTIENLPSWAEGLYEDLTRCFPDAKDKPEIGELLRTSGILQFRRRQIDPGWCMIHEDQNTQTFRTIFRIPRSESHIVQLIEEGRITGIRAFLIQKSMCSVCKGDYLLCTCSKYLDHEVIQQIQQSEILGFYWTDRPA